MKTRRQYLDGEYLTKNPSYHVEDSAWKATQILKMLRRHALQPRTVAEVGCGAGEILVQLARHLPETRFRGYEPSPQGFALCQSRRQERVEYFQTDFALAHEEVQDLVLCVDVLEHLEDCYDFLRGLIQCGRHFIFHIPLEMNVQMVLRAEPILRVRKLVGHLHYFTKETALATLEDCAYAVEDWFYTSSGVECPHSGRARLLRWPRRLCFALWPDLTVRILGGYSLLVLARPPDVARTKLS